MNLTQLTDYVWKQTDTTEFDLPATTIASYIDEGFQRTIAAENAWPFYEKTWDVTIIADGTTATIDGEVNIPTVISLVSVDDYKYKLQQIEQVEAERKFGLLPTTSGRPYFYSFWERNIHFWPITTTDTNRQFVMRGYRHPVNTFAADGEVDADPRLHKPLAHYAVALAYAQQEDEALETVYMSRWQRDVELARKAIMDPSSNRPIVMYGNFPRTPVGGYRGGNIGFTINNGI